MHDKNTWEIIRGDTEEIRVHFQEYPPAKNGGTLRLTIRTQADMPKIISKSVTVSGQESVTIKLNPEETKDLGGWYVYDVEFTNSNGDVRTLVLGNIHARKDVSYGN